MNYIKLSLFLLSFTCITHCSSASSSTAAKVAAISAPQSATLSLSETQKADKAKTDSIFKKHNVSKYFSIHPLVTNSNKDKQASLSLVVYSLHIPSEQYFRHIGLLATESMSFLEQLFPFHIEQNRYNKLEDLFSMQLNISAFNPIEQVSFYHPNVKCFHDMTFSIKEWQEKSLQWKAAQLKK